MMKFFRTALYFKNVPMFERVVRVVMGVDTATCATQLGLRERCCENGS